jgi:hypothetical protein
MADQLTPSQDLAELFFKAMDRAFGSIEDGGRSLTPFTMTVSQTEEPEVKDFEEEEGLALARESVADAAVRLRLYAIVGEGYVKREGRQWDAVLVEAGEAGQDHAFLFCQRCQHPEGEQRWERVGGPEVIDRPPCLLARVAQGAH